MAHPFYVTTPIYYVNAEPHLGSAYTTVIADILARYHRLFGDDTYFLTGTDEHGDKIANMAREAGVAPGDYADRISALFRETWPQLDIHSDDFIRTTEERHKEVVRRVMQQVYDAGHIYFGEYGGPYCFGCERFYTEKELVNGLCPQHLTEPTYIKEANYFFRMSAFQDWLIDRLTRFPDTIRPEQYRREVLSFLREPLEDLCISRPKSRLTWGITLPFDEQYVTYVWFDALVNYISALDYPDGPLYARYWPAAQHLIAKDILKPHGIYWPCILQAAGVPLYRHLNVHGYWTVEGEKMSKSRGNFVRPLELVERYGLDPLRYVLAREMVYGQDADFSERTLVARYNADLANDLGNLLNRVVAMSGRYAAGSVPPPLGTEDQADRSLREAGEALPGRVREALDAMLLHVALEATMDLVKATNRYLETKAPWLAWKAGDRDGVGHTLYYAAEALRLAGLMLSPVMPGKMSDLASGLGLARLGDVATSGHWGVLAPGAPLGRALPLFPRREVAVEA
ncbi:MAG: methionine--tRNA ligase [Chloroflexota bacterium]